MATIEKYDQTHRPNEQEDQSGDHTETTDWTHGPNEWEDQSGDHTATTDWTSEPNKCLPVEWRLPDNTCTKTCVMSQETGMRPDGRNCVCIMPNHEYFVMPFDLATGTQTGTTAGLPAPKGICIPPSTAHPHPPIDPNYPCTTKEMSFVLPDKQTCVAECPVSENLIAKGLRCVCKEGHVLS